MFRYADDCPTADIYVSNSVVTPLPPKPIGLWLKDFNNLTVLGEGSLLLCHGYMTPIVIDHSIALSIRDVAVDWVHPTVVEAQVSSVTNMSIDVSIHPDCPFRVGNNTITFDANEGWALDGVHGVSPISISDHQATTLCQEYNPKTDVTWRRSNPFAGAQITQLDPQSVRLKYESTCLTW